ncbi:hypothetical protein [Allostella humosa]|uniref:hypothetical protein n=1 Tax=Stella humosa TaxID=94 RepID=UPI00114F90D4|nr:hypothetical protein [Stella humosa]
MPGEPVERHPGDDPRLAGLETSWVWRRRAVWLTLLFCMGGLFWLMGWGRHDSRLHETIASALALLLGSVVMAYIAGATYDDRSRRQTWAGWEASRLATAAQRRDDQGAAAG